MKRMLTIAVLVLLAGCAGAGGGTGHELVDSEVRPIAGVLPLELEATPAADTWLVTLKTPAARDLYQIAGSMEFDATRCEILAVQPGGDLGDPDQTYFAWGTPQSGSLDFAYTRRFYGPGVDGSADILVLTVATTDRTSLDSIRLLAGPTDLVARDSGKQPLEIRLTAGVQQ